jgi:type IV pilus assembly protein PilA
MMRLHKNKKGFTLVEIIVVLVILAILAAAAIPTMLGFVNDAKAKANIAEARACYIAAQMIATETIAAQATPTGTTVTNTQIKAVTGDEIKGTVEEITVGADGKVPSLVYNAEDGTKITITPGGTATVE